MKPETFTSAFFELLDETFEHVQGNYLDKGTSLFETLAGVSAAEASRAVSPKGATIAAHVKHVEFYLTVLEDVLQGKEPGKLDWNEIWRTTRAVSAPEWEILKKRLQETHARVLALTRSFDTWEGKGQVSGALAILVHTAYHLGAIRQALRVVGEP
jgi:DinB family protein